MTTAYLQRLRRIRREAWLIISANASWSFTYRGVFAVVFNLYLLRLGYGPEFIGLVNGIYMLTVGLSLPAGLLARRWGNRRLLIWGKALEAVGYTLVAVADLLPGAWQGGWLLGVYTLAGIGGAAWSPPYTVLLYGASGPEERDHAFSLSYASVPAAGVLGNLLGGAMPGLFAAALGRTLEDAAPYRFALLAGALVNLASVVALLHTRKEPAAASRREARERAPFPWATIAVMVLYTLLFSAAYGPIMTFYNVYLSDHLQLPVAAVGLILAIARLISIPGVLSGPVVVARWGRFRAIIVLLVGLAASAVLLFVPQGVAVAAAFIIAITCYLLVMTISSVFSQELVVPEWRATMSGSISTASGVGVGLVSVAGGYVIGAWGYTTLFALGAAFALASAALFWGYFRVPRGELRGAAAAAAGE